eukprot:1359179-Amorphochlora_amoeboformis.AAC.1
MNAGRVSIGSATDDDNLESPMHIGHILGKKGRKINLRKQEANDIKNDKNFKALSTAFSKKSPRA